MAGFRALLLLALTLNVSFAVLGRRTKGDVGVCYGLVGDNLPSPKDVVSLYKRHNIRKMRIFEPYPEVLEALRGSNIDLTLGVKNTDIPTLASSEDAANSWFISNVHPYVNDIRITYISVGNEVIPGEFSDSILPAMQNLQNVLRSNNLGTRTTTVVHSAVLGTSFPPSAATFSDSARPFISGIIQFLSSQKSPLLVNLYPYFPYAADPENIRLDYAQFRTTEPLIKDGALRYSNLLDAMLDGFFSAMEKEGVNDVNIIISETGWPHDGNGNITTPGLAATYNRNFIHHVNDFEGTPKRPAALLEGFIFAMFDEDLKDPGVEQHWGLFSPNMQPNYNIFG
ncbi:probable glucan endo-1,3-beta-glucosidase BG5 [Chenopodium quinoa]|uniref:Glucan endo-1,3-beta-D-glucosidase n=1 Tax=Chenopodium quinoa TaxID=63459 RepID=A0A803LPK3_CHEQI|nr:probable glucan endo-1,3-beta-glucosidase BG5 [Chenopodium quinoa]